MRFWCKFGATLYRAILTIFTISNGIAKTPRDNQTKRVCKLACKRASTDCSAVARRMRALCVAPSGNACTASEYNFSFADFHTKKCSAHAGHFLFSLEYRGANEAHLRCMKNDASCRL